MCEVSGGTEEDDMSTTLTLMSLAAAVQRQTKSSGTHLVFFPPLYKMAADSPVWKTNFLGIAHLGESKTL